MLEIYFLLFYIPRKVRRIAKEKGQSAWAWSLMAIGAWVITELALIFIGVVCVVLMPELERNTPVLICTYLVPLAGAIFASDLVIKRLRKMPTGSDAPYFKTNGIE